MTKTNTPVADPETGEVVEPTSVELVPLHEVREAVLTGRMPEISDPDAISREIALQLLNAESAEDLFSVPGTTKPTEVMGLPFVLERVRFMPSTIEDSKSPIYALMDLRGENGKLQVVPCGGQALVVQCLRAVEEGWLPIGVKLIEVGQERPGRSRPIYLELA